MANENPKKHKTYRDLRGQKFGRWTPLEKVTPDGVGKAKWLCRCDCGTEKVIFQQALIGNRTQSCGCYRRDWASTHGVTHGMKKTRLYRIYHGVKDRTCNPNSKYWGRYGGRGITICDAWKTFTNFCEWAMANGYTEELTLDRIDNDGNYEPNNCRWVDYKTQENNRGNTVYCLYNGERIPVAILMERLGKSRFFCIKNYGEKNYGE